MPSVRSGRYSPGPIAGSSSVQNRLFQYSCTAGESQEEPNFLATVSFFPLLLFNQTKAHPNQTKASANDFPVNEEPLQARASTFQCLRHVFGNNHGASNTTA